MKLPGALVKVTPFSVTFCVPRDGTVHRRVQQRTGLCRTDECHGGG